MVSVCKLCNISCFVGKVGSGGRFWFPIFIFFPEREAILIIDVLYSGTVSRLPLSDPLCQDTCPENI